MSLLVGRASDQDGFSIIEVLVALGVLFVSLLALARTSTVAFTDVAFSRQRQTANALANQLLEEVRGLPYATLQKGMRTSDLAGDPRVFTCAGDLYIDACPPTPGAEKIVHIAGLPVVSPLVPYTGSVGPPEYPSTFSWRIYVTEAADAPDRGAYRVSAIVSWQNAQRQGLRNSVDAQTLVYSPVGCVDIETHPFGAPCQPYFYGNGNFGGGGFVTFGALDDVTFDSMSSDFLRGSANSQMEQVVRVEGGASLPAVRSVVGGAETFDGDAGSTVSDTDPSTAAGAYDQQTLPPQAPASVSVSGGGNELRVTRDGGSTGATTSTTAAGGTNSCNLQVDGLPCGYATGSVGGSVLHTLTAPLAGTAELVGVGTTGTNSTVYMRRFVPGAGQLGLLREQTSWVLPEIRVGGLPSGGTAPAGWQGYWVRLTGFSASARAEAGEGTVAPSVTISGGQVQAWNGTGYTTVAVTPSGSDVPITPVVHESGPVGDLTRVEITGNILVEASSTAEVISSGTTRTEAEARVGSPLVVSLNYRLLQAGVLIADLNLELSAGRSTARAVFQPAPS